MSYVIPLAIPQNSASTLDKATTFYFLLFHMIRFPPTKVKYLASRFPLISITCTFQIPKNSQNCCHMLYLQSVHKSTYDSNCICNIWLCIRKIDKFAYHSLIFSFICQLLSLNYLKTMIGYDWCVCGFTVQHASFC